MNSIKICSIYDCSRKHSSKGYCYKHYIKFKKYGDPLKVHRDMDHPEICSIDGCNNKYRSKGYCEKHYKKMYKYGNPLKITHNMDHPEFCATDGCNSKYKGRGYCNKHYKKEYPEITLKANKKYLTKLGKEFDMTSSEYQRTLNSWSPTVKKQDDYTCQVCGIKGNSKTLHAHHIFYKSLYPQLSLNVNNGISLCIPCHSELHGFEVNSVC